MDIVGCPECPNGMVGDIRDLRQFKDGQFGAVYVGHVFEVLSGSDIKKAFAEVTRVGDSVYVAHLPESSLSSLFCPTVRSVIHSAPPTTPYIRYTDLVTRESGQVNPLV